MAAETESSAKFSTIVHSPEITISVKLSYGNYKKLPLHYVTIRLGSKETQTLNRETFEGMSFSTGEVFQSKN